MTREEEEMRSERPPGPIETDAGLEKEDGCHDVALSDVTVTCA